MNACSQLPSDLYQTFRTALIEFKMRITRIFSMLALTAIGASAMKQPQKQFLISFPQDTPQSELDNYKSAISSAVRTYHSP